MKKSSPFLQEEKAGIAVTIFAILLGGWTRISVPLSIDFPINDGGLFYAMILVIKNHHFIMPEFVQYNGADIPFAYPPLGLYAAALLSSLLRLDPLQILLWLPPLVLILTIPAFFWLAKPILKSSFTASVATFIYSFTPSATSWAMMGGGLTRSFGLLFLLLTLASVYRLFTSNEKKYLFASIGFSSLTVLSHPEATLHTAGLCMFIWLLYGRNRNGAIRALWVGFGTLLFTSIWWTPILFRFGITPFLAASQTGSYFPFAFLAPFFFAVTNEPQITLIAVLGVIGFGCVLSQRNYLLVGFYLLPYFIEPRNSSAYAAIVTAMLAGLAIEQAILPAISKIPLEQNRLAQLTLVYIALLLMGNAFTFNAQLAANTLSKENRAAFEWVKSNTPEESRVLILTSEVNGFCDGVSEWFPVLTERISPTTIQGLEWLPNGLEQARESREKVQACIVNSDFPSCLTSQEMIEYDYVYIAREFIPKPYCGNKSFPIKDDRLISRLEGRNQFTLVYQTNQVAIFSFNQEE